MLPNGPAVCFSRRNPTTAPGRVLVPRASGATKLSRCKEGLSRVFAVMVQILLRAGAIAIQVLCERYFITVYKFYALYWRSVAVQN